jgi:sulfur-oxidizing protein SoxA
MFNRVLAIALFTLPTLTQASPESDQQDFQNYFLDNAPSIPLEQYSEDITPADPTVSGPKPYIHLLDKGKRLFGTFFENGNGYSYCFRSNGIGIATDYPYFDILKGEVKTLAQEINECRIDNGEQPYPYGSEELNAIVTYMTDTSRKNIVNVIMPADQGAEKAFTKGKQFFYARRGQLNMACAHCHIDHAQKRYEDKLLAPALGLPNRMPSYDKDEGVMVSLHQRFSRCMALTKAKPYPLQSEAYRNLEFYLYYVNNGLPLNGPSVQQ